MRMERNGLLGRLQGLLTELIRALSRNDVEAIERATEALQQFVDENTHLLTQIACPSDLTLLCRLLEAAQCLVWTRLLTLATQSDLPTRSLVAGQV